MKYNPFDLEKELSRSRSQDDSNDKIFLKTRTWDCLDDNKINDLLCGVTLVSEELNKENIQELERKLNQFDLKSFCGGYSPMVNKDKDNIGCVSNLKNMVETTHFANKLNDVEKDNEINDLRHYACTFRRILGDGNCFYRGLIFSILENIILTNNIMQMREILILFHDKMSENNKLVKEKKYLKRIEEMKTEIVLGIIYIIINEMENDITKAYKTLLKSFLYINDFDRGIIFFTRYLIYEYISANEGRFFSEESPVNIGALLPDGYYKDNGNENENEYYYEKYYEEELMKPGAFAEKIVLHVVPFVFNIHINILAYNLAGNRGRKWLEEGTFSNENAFQNTFQAQVNLLFRINHYDIYYKYEFYNFHRNNLNILLNEKCLECKNPLKEDNVFGHCENCLLNQLNSFLIEAYLEFVKDGNNLVNSRDKFEELLKQKMCKISIQDNISLYEAIYNTKFKFDDLFFCVRSKLCLFCGKVFNNIDEYFQELPCKCRLCSKRCFDHYLDYMKGRIKPNHEIHPTYLKYFNLLNCFCGFDYNTQNVFDMIKELETKQMNEKKKIYQDYIFNLWNWKCCICKKNFEANKDFLKIEFRCKDIDDNYLNSKTQFKHLICNECYQENNINNNKQINCIICDLEHEVVNTIKVNNYNEEVDN